VGAHTREQFAVLEVLMAAEGGVISVEELLERAWGENAAPFRNAVRASPVSAMRERLGEPWVVATVPGSATASTRARAGRPHPCLRARRLGALIARWELRSTRPLWDSRWGRRLTSELHRLPARADAEATGKGRMGFPIRRRFHAAPGLRC
jgi:hypothetical protein